MKITEHGVACCSIILGEKATWLEAHTAQELRCYIHRISGAWLHIVKEKSAGSMHGGRILIGCPATHTIISAFEEQEHVLPAQSDVENDCIAIAVRGEVLVISGSNQRSVHYSACHLLQVQFGVGFYFDGDSITENLDMWVPEMTLVVLL